MLEGYNGKIIINWGVNIFLETLGEFLSLCLNVGSVFVIFPITKPMQNTYYYYFFKIK